MYVQEKGHVYVVINMGSALAFGYVYGVYSNREIAEAKARKERLKGLFDDDEGYIAVLKKSIEGPTLKNHTIIENDEVALVSVTK